MRTSKVKNIALFFAAIVFGVCAFAQAISFTVGQGNYYVSVGDHDYLPYAYNAYPGGYNGLGNLSFQTAMSDYGTWVNMQPFGNVWRPYVAAGWRPYTQGHWAYTQYGPTWEGYEPWAWAGYHYGNWAFSQQMGWVWIPGYDWHPGRVAWAQGYNSLGWMPLPPTGYDYSRGYLSYMGPTNQFSYNDSDFSIGFGVGSNDYYYGGGPYYDPRYRDLYYNQGYLGSGVNLWTFIDPNNFGSDNYANYYYGGDYARDLFDRRLVRISTRPLDRVVVERIVRQPVRVETVRVTQAQVDGRPVRLVAVEGEEENIRKNANTVVREVIAPAFAEKGRTFKGKQAKTQAALDKSINRGSTEQVQTVNSDDLVREARQNEQRQEQRRTQIKNTKRAEVVRIEKEGRIREKNNPGQLKKEEDTRTRNSNVNPPPTSNRPERPEQPQPDATRRNNRPVEEPKQDQERERRMNEEHSNVRPDTDENSNRRDERDVRSDQENPDKDVNNPDRDPNEVRSDKEKSDQNAANNDQNQSDKQKKAKNKKQKKDKDKDKNNPDEPPQN